MQVQLLGGAAAALILAGVSAVGEHRRNNRRDPDNVGMVPWTLIQMLAIVGAIVLVSVALNAN